MPKQETILSVFVASPEDVTEERDCIEEAIRELNQTWSKNLGIRLELIRWETHVYPGISQEPQEVINEQISGDYDIFVGIMWTRFGTPTKHSGSGTEEEFNKAYEKFKENSKKIRIMFYFKEAPISPTKLDTNQLALVKIFRKQLGEKGTLYWTFNSIEEFTQLIRTHLSFAVQEWKKTWGETTKVYTSAKFNKSKAKVSKDSEGTNEEEEGLLDLMEIGMESFEILQEVTEHITKDMLNLEIKIRQRTEELKKAGTAEGKFNIKQKKRAINFAAVDMEHFNIIMEERISIFSKSHSKGTDAFIRSISILRDFKTEKEEVEQTLKQVKAIESSLKDLRPSMIELYKKIESLPRITTAFNKAKRRTLSVLEKFANIIENSIYLTIDIERALEEIMPK